MPRSEVLAPALHLHTSRERVRMPRVQVRLPGGGETWLLGELRFIQVELCAGSVTFRTRQGEN